MATVTEKNLEQFPIPPLIRRNTFLLAVVQAVVGAGIQLLPALGAISIVQLLGSSTWAGVASAIAGLSRAMIAYPVGKLSDTKGRKSGLYLGLVLALVGTIITGWGMAEKSFLWFVIGMFVFTAGVGATQQLRVAAADMYPPSRRSEGISLVLMGSLFGAFLSPVIVEIAERIAPSLDINPLALAWYLVPIGIIPAFFLTALIRPDPKQIALNLGQYYANLNATISNAEVFQSTLLQPRRVAIWSGVAAQGQMVLLMTMTSLALHKQGCGFDLISLSVSLHVLGMFALSWPIGRLADRIGRRPVMLWGLLLAGIGSLMVGFLAQYWLITAGTILVGIGWCGAYNGATSIIADTTPPNQRGRAIGVLDVWANIAGTILPLMAGFMVEGLGIWSIGVFGVLILIFPAWLILGLNETSPGKYLDSR